MQLIEQLQNIVKEKTHTVAQIAREADIKPDRIYKWLDGRGKPKAEDSDKLVKWLKKVGIVLNGNGAGNRVADPLVHRTSSEWKAIRFLIQEVASLRSQRENRSYQDCLDELNNAVALLIGTH